MSLRRGLPFFLAAILLGLTQGLGQGFVSANIPQLAGDLGISTTDASWLMAAYMIPRASLPLMLIKIRTQYGLRRFAEVGIAAYVLVAFTAVWADDFRSAVVVQFLSGVSSAPLSTLAFLYMLEPLSPQNKMRIGLPLVMAVLMTAPNLARVISPWLIGDGGMAWVHLTALSLAMISLALVYWLPLRPVPHQKVIQPMDFLSFGLIAWGFGSITTAFIMGPLHWWADQPWIGWLMVSGVGALALAVVVELNRAAPLVDFRWIVSPAILHLAVTLLLFRLVLSEQSTGAPRMFQVLGLAPSQLVVLFSIICAASVLGALACVAWMKPGRIAHFHFVALILIAAGAWIDAHSTLDTRPEQMCISQAMIGFAGMLFLPPALLMGLGAAMAKGPSYLLSFFIVFLSTQSIGGVMGSGLFSTLVNDRQTFHLATLTDQLQPANPVVTAEIARQISGLSQQLSDPVMQRAQAVSQIVQDASAQAYVMAYNDAYFVICLLALAALGALTLHLFRDWLWRRITPVVQPEPDAPLPKEAAR